MIQNDAYDIDAYDYNRKNDNKNKTIYKNIELEKKTQSNILHRKKMLVCLCPGDLELFVQGFFVIQSQSSHIND